MARALELEAMEKTGIVSSNLLSLMKGDDVAYDELEEMMHQQEITNQLNMHDPYLNPGQDHVVDEVYHGIDHGSDHF